jgi:hypothetical protein
MVVVEFSRHGMGFRLPGGMTLATGLTMPLQGQTGVKHSNLFARTPVTLDPRPLPRLPIHFTAPSAPVPPSVASRPTKPSSFFETGLAGYPNLLD